jgi:hypothetical protein
VVAREGKTRDTRNLTFAPGNRNDMMYLFQESSSQAQPSRDSTLFFLAELIYRGIDDEGGDVGG